MEQIAPYAVWIGHADDGRAFREIFDRGIRAVIQLAMEEPDIATPRELISCRLPLIDGASNDPDILALAIETVARLMERNVPTLVCCGAGMSRSPVIVAAAISKLERISLEAALTRVVATRPSDVAPALVTAVFELLQQEGI